MKKNMPVCLTNRIDLDKPIVNYNRKPMEDPFYHAVAVWDKDLWKGTRFLEIGLFTEEEVEASITRARKHQSDIDRLVLPGYWRKLWWAICGKL